MFSFLFNVFLLSTELIIAHAGWVDPDTDLEFHSTEAFTDYDDREYVLVFSDEFEQDGRTFHDGNDPRWTSLDKNDYTNDALHFYSSENVRTSNGVLNITTFFKENSFLAMDEDTDKKVIETKHIQSAMVQGWNKFCFTGGIVEISAKLPGKPKVGGLWPALWMLGNLARATYVGSSDYMWPWSYDVCDPATRVSQELNACDRVHHYGLNPFEGRGAPEIDILEAMGGEPGPLPNTHIERPYFSASLQIAPGLRRNRPSLGFLPKPGHWYEGLEYGNATDSDLNPFFYGVTLVHKPKSYTYQSDALSANMMINASHFETHHTYRVEWEPPNEDGVGGYIKWYCDGELVYGIQSDVLKLTNAQIPSEPLYILLNTAVSSSWGFPKPCPDGCDCECFNCFDPDCTCGLPEGFCDNIPSSFEIDYVRVYQAVNETKHEMGCSTERRPTELFIKGYKERYMSKGDKQPILPVKNGGARCRGDRDCGGTKHGICDARKQRCSCNQNSTGPTCMAPVGFDETLESPGKEKSDDFKVYSMIFPIGLTTALSVFVLGCCLVIYLDVRRKIKELSMITPLEPLSMSKHQSYRYHFLPLITSPEAEIDMHMADTNPLIHQTPENNSQSIDIIADNSHHYRPRLNHNGLLRRNMERTPSANPYSNNEKVVSYCVIDGRLIDT